MPATSRPWGLEGAVAAGDVALSGDVARRPATATVRVGARHGMERGGRIMVPVSQNVVAVHAPRRASLHDGRGVESRRALREYWPASRRGKGACNECGCHAQVVRGGAGGRAGGGGGARRGPRDRRPPATSSPRRLPGPPSPPPIGCSWG